jgi:hypothetical protein
MEKKVKYNSFTRKRLTCTMLVIACFFTMAVTIADTTKEVNINHHTKLETELKVKIDSEEKNKEFLRYNIPTKSHEYYNISYHFKNLDENYNNLKLSIDVDKLTTKIQNKDKARVSLKFENFKSSISRDEINTNKLAKLINVTEKLQAISDVTKKIDGCHVNYKIDARGQISDLTHGCKKQQTADEKRQTEHIMQLLASTIILPESAVGDGDAWIVSQKIGTNASILSEINYKVTVNKNNRLTITPHKNKPFFSVELKNKYKTWLKKFIIEHPIKKEISINLENKDILNLPFLDNQHNAIISIKEFIPYNHKQHVTVEKKALK